MKESDRLEALMNHLSAMADGKTVHAILAEAYAWHDVWLRWMHVREMEGNPVGWIDPSGDLARAMRKAKQKQEQQP